MTELVRRQSMSSDIITHLNRKPKEISEHMMQMLHGM